MLLDTKETLAQGARGEPQNTSDCYYPFNMEAHYGHLVAAFPLSTRENERVRK
jgi:hypothetical protein